MIGQLLTGRYLILERLGSGGFSETYLARDKYLPHHPLCVVKCLHLAANNPIPVETAQRWFENEARLLEQLGQHHSQIPTLFAYCCEDEQVYLVQDYIEGENLGEWVAQGKRLTAKSAIAFLAELLPVLEYLHSHQVVHRDITPNNLICRRRDSKLVLIDFGAACLLSEATETKPEDDIPFAIGTPGYMPDEQQLGMAQLNSDLYALGILVIHLLTGVHPKQFQQDLISGELDWHLYLQQPLQPALTTILNRMVQSNFRDRYQQATEVLADLQALPKAHRFQPEGALSQGRNLAQKMVVPAAIALLLAVVGSQYSATHQNQIVPWMNKLEQPFHSSNSHLTLLHQMPVAPGVEQMVITSDNRTLVTVGSDRILNLWALPSGSLVKSLPGHSAPVTALTISDDSKLLASGDAGGTVRLWDTNSGALLRTLDSHQQAVTAIAFSPDHQMIISGSKDGTLRCWDVATGIRMRTLVLPNSEVTTATFGTSSSRVISASRMTTGKNESVYQLQVWDLPNGQLQQTLAGHTDAIVSLYMTDDHTLYSFGKDRGLVWDLNHKELEMVFPEDSASPIATAMNDRNIMIVHSNGKITLWTHKSGQIVPHKAGALGKNLDVAISPDHRYLASWSSDRQLQIWQFQEESQ